MYKVIAILALLFVTTPVVAADVITKWVVVGWSHSKDPTIQNEAYTIDLQLIPEDASNIGIMQGTMTLRLTDGGKANAVTVGDLIQVDLTKLPPP